MLMYMLSAASVLCQGLGPVAGARDADSSHSVPVDTMQCIWQRLRVHTHDTEDSSIMRYDMSTASQAMYNNRVFTDATIIVRP